MSNKVRFLFAEEGGTAPLLHSADSGGDSKANEGMEARGLRPVIATSTLTCRGMILASRKERGEEVGQPPARSFVNNQNGWKARRASSEHWKGKGRRGRRDTPPKGYLARALVLLKTQAWFRMARSVRRFPQVFGQQRPAKRNSHENSSKPCLHVRTTKFALTWRFSLEAATTAPILSAL